MAQPRSVFRSVSFIFAALLGLATGAACAQSAKDAYVQDARGAVVRNSSFGDARFGNLCWRTGTWTPALSIAECDPDIAPKPASPGPKPPMAAPRKPAAPSAAPVVPRKCDFAETLGADESFEFNKSTLRNAAKARLDALVLKAKTCSQINALLVTGHTDRLGSAAYNLKLSELRAAAVAGYLGSKGLSGATIGGAGKAQPVKACDGKMPRKALIECLAPNRRVVIEIQGAAR